MERKSSRSRTRVALWAEIADLVSQEASKRLEPTLLATAVYLVTNVIVVVVVALKYTRHSGLPGGDGAAAWLSLLRGWYFSRTSVVLTFRARERERQLCGLHTAISSAALRSQLPPSRRDHHDDRSANVAVRLNPTRPINALSKIPPENVNREQLRFPRDYKTDRVFRVAHCIQ